MSPAKSYPQGVPLPVLVWHYSFVAEPRFLTLTDVSETLNISAAQTYALVRSGELPAIKVGGRGQWRVEASELENYIARMYEQTRQLIRNDELSPEVSPN